MADNYLITGYHGEPHVTSENDRGIHAATFGAGKFVLPVGEQFRAEYIGNNTIRMYDGKLMDNGAAAGIPAGEYIDLLIANAGQGKKRNDLIVFQYEIEFPTLIESGKFVVIQGVETTGTPSDPELEQEDLLSNKAGFDQMALWRVSVSGTTISAPVKVFSVSAGLDKKAPAGYGLGENKPSEPTENDLNKMKKAGWFVIISTTANSPVTYGYGLVIPRQDDSLTQVVFSTDNSDGTILIRRCYLGTWGEWEYLNPPMRNDVEYRTTERWKGKAVYTKLIDTGALPNATSKSVATNITGFTGLVSISGAVMSGDSYNPISIISDITDVWLNGTGTALSIKTKADLSARSASVCLKYTKG